jgi:hypothetical protein
MNRIAGGTQFIEGIRADRIRNGRASLARCFIGQSYLDTAQSGSSGISHNAADPAVEGLRGRRRRCTEQEKQ